jgi:hypothetical protein
MWKQTHREKLKNQKEFKIYNITESSKTWRQLKQKDIITGPSIELTTSFRDLR